MIYSAARRKLVDWLRLQLIGPAMHGNLQGISPLDRYPTGALFPILSNGEGVDPAFEDSHDESIDDALDDDSVAGAVEPAVKHRRYIPPSAVGFSFYVQEKNWRIRVNCRAARYERTGERDELGRFKRQEYERIALGGDEAELMFTAPKRVDVLLDEHDTPRAGVDVQARRHGEGTIITVSLFNKQSVDASESGQVSYEQRGEKTLFEVELRCYLDEGTVGTYPHVEYSLLNDEEQELEIQYQERKIYAIGHGAAADWLEKDTGVAEIWSNFMPCVEVPQVTADVARDENQILSMAYLASLATQGSAVCDELHHFVETYANWVGQQARLKDQFSGLEKQAGTRITARMEQSLQRMRAGVRLLKTNPMAVRAFALANQAMSDQMCQADITKGINRDPISYKWRPFQLAFLLTTLESTVDEQSDFRDVVDLIWFPTGGGKTEAYLGLIAFLIVWRRLKFPDTGGGTTTLMRYTLRLLTTQQFQRATRMICALELIRRNHPGLGNEAITIGMWVGSATTPNTFDKAKQLVERARNDSEGALRSLVLERCPWCGDRFDAQRSYIASADAFHFRCSNRECSFGAHDDGKLPCSVIDEALYKHPPTLLIATIDKFARLAWEERTSAFFGKNANRPPELVIQDELHLIASALGSVAGLYEAALHTVLASKNIYPKYIASTATIRMAETQVERLYASKVTIFPPPGLSCDDSYFAKTVPIHVRPGRLYVGYFAPMLDRQHCMAPLTAVLLMAPESVFPNGEPDRELLLDAWWTQVVYHGSLRGVGNSHNSFMIDVRDWCSRLKQEAELSGDKLKRPAPHIAQLTGISSAEENARTFSRLEHNRQHAEGIDAVLATNMVSVGLDVGRLALMVINGQPLTTAEYIQASSRVGRSEVPGIVITNYYRDQARSLSHYENFRPYHESFYRFVEPTSVTPFTYQARMRALHAALVIAIRYSCSHLLSNATADSFDINNEKVQKVISLLKIRCVKADPARREEIVQHLDSLLEQWQERVVFCRSAKRKLNYQSMDSDKASDRLIYTHEDKIAGLWPTLHSMRNVEKTGLLGGL